jgi:hypothetical protein
MAGSRELAPPGLVPTSLPAGASVAEAREALAYWSQCASQLPWHRRAARREARVMVARWRARLICAHLERWGLGFVAVALAPLLHAFERPRAAHVRRLAVLVLWRTPLGRRALVAVAALVTAAVASVALLAVLGSQLGLL